TRMAGGSEGGKLDDVMHAEPLGGTDHLDLDSAEARRVVRQQEQSFGAGQDRVQLVLLDEVGLDPCDMLELPGLREVAQHGTHRLAALGQKTYQLAADGSGAAGDGDAHRAFPRSCW